MLPAPKRDRISLADVMPSCLASLAGLDNKLGLPAVTAAVVVLADGLGAEALASRAGHARTLANASGSSAPIDTVFPTTTAAALASLTTGVSPGLHGLVGYSVLDPAHGRLVNQLTGWDANLDPFTWQSVPTVFETARNDGILTTAIGPERYRDSGFSRAVLRGADYVSGASIADRIQKVIEVLRANRERKLIYMYVPELDKISHADGTESERWTRQLESLDGEVKELAASLGQKTGLLVTADHGSLDVPQHAHVLIDESPDLIDGIRFVGGEPRCLQLHCEPDTNASHRDRLVESWRAIEGDRAWVVTRAQAIDAGWFGDVRPDVEPRIGDVLIAARKRVAYYDSRTATESARAMVGQHGSWSNAEVRIPLLRFGAFAQ